ncbi:hypothetical protein FB599_0689 [Herbaspirillum sp. SJZ130]|nr:hypothetical protein FB599_0689 [Herbaspirillum sp. SJZ130]TQK15277.1 hypothetical protein FB598_0627 [Herbaspirillum sp. SJZ106]TWC62586.1 hypothetical protein FB597_11325 [Herbaspirillum sp. SJZ099]
MRAPLRLRFGFPRVYLVKMLQRKIAEQLYIGSEACAIGMRDEDGRFLTLADGDEFDGPDFTLRLIYAIGSQRVFDHGIDVSIGILLGCYVLTVRDQRFNIGFIPTLDEAMLTTAVRWIIRNLDTAALAR